MFCLDYLYKLASGRYRGGFHLIPAAVLSVFSFVYGILVRILLTYALYHKTTPAIPVISVGNITVGGTGKTSLVEYLALKLKSYGKKPAIVTRGYKRPASKGSDTYDLMGDEPALLQKNTGIPVIVDSNRLRGITRALEESAADSIILDDAFQQWKIVKRLEIVCIDTANPFGCARLLPRGLLREPLTGLDRADVIVFTKTNIAAVSESLKQTVRKFAPRALQVESMHKPVGFYSLYDTSSMQKLDGRSCLLFSGIGDPHSFEEGVKHQGISVMHTVRFSDHHSYTAGDVDRIVGQARRCRADTIITTEKDAMRLQRLQLSFGSFPVFVFKIELILTKKEDEFLSRLRSVYSV
ncbi:MAG TPA: tetraacyldisaccharide 4'-kinase [Candidatus Omnitrophota bacterium]|nr:tetraacyldisaccharide 4'-kinase [Candidatus Omnitrophota bacterium]HPT06807.1 tetraacyldisaccharide 4'-kinase [Candidatus Omnitrophota bacterium]